MKRRKKVLEKKPWGFLKKGKSEEDEEEGRGPLLDSLPFIDQQGGPYQLFLTKP